jgi:hypothetical protein
MSNRSPGERDQAIRYEARGRAKVSAIDRVVRRLTKAQLGGLEATARGEVVLTHTGSLYTITGPVGSNTLWALLRDELIARGPEVHGQIKTPMVLAPNGAATIGSRDTLRPALIFRRRSDPLRQRPVPAASHRWVRLALRPALSGAIPELARRRSLERQNCWHVYYGDVRVGTIAMRPGVPVDVDQWSWQCGFYPLEQGGRRLGNTTATFEQARDAFEAAWNAYLPLCTEADFNEYRRRRAFTAWKYAMHDAGLPLPTQTISGRTRCFCGAAIDIKGVDRHIHEAHMRPLHAGAAL